MNPRLLAFGLIMSASVALATRGPPNTVVYPGDPIALRVNFAAFTRSEVVAAGGREGPGRGVERLVRRALLLQEARALKMESGLPGDPEQRAEAFLDNFFAAETVCNGFSPSALAEQYSRMKPRWVHGPLVTVDDLLYVCGSTGDPDELACRRAAHSLAELSWAPIAAEVRSVDELAILQAAQVTHPLAVVERSFEIDERDPERRFLASQPDGRGFVETGLFGARLRVIARRRGAQNRGLEDPGVRHEVEAELCASHRKRAKEDYVRSIAAVARIEIVKGVLPDPSEFQIGPTRP